MISEHSPIYLKDTVYDAALNRMRRLFDEFGNVIVGMSGGKDSTVVYNLALQVAREKNRLPLKVMFLDQEAEWDCVIDFVRSVMSNPDVEPMWFQIPMFLFNASSSEDSFLHCWEEGADWIRDKEPNAYKENIYTRKGRTKFSMDFKIEEFNDMFGKILEVMYPNEPACYLAGVRCEESPARKITLTAKPTYKDITWGRILNAKKHHYTFYPLYDWNLSDVWKAIHSNGWEYTKLYDYMYQYGVPVQKMRVSNIHHETAVKSLYFLQELEPETWNKVTKRLQGLSTAGQLNTSAFEVPKELPPMFKDWNEYRDYLLKHLVQGDSKHKFQNLFNKMDGIYTHDAIKIRAAKVGIRAILRNDINQTVIKNFLKEPEVMVYRMWKEGHGGPFKRDLYIPKDAQRNYLKP
jgi:predicted phosphoadenosine phosphosulfate sulfurtransferase